MRFLLQLLSFLVLCAFVVDAAHRSPFKKLPRRVQKGDADPMPPFVEQKWYKGMRLDHFNFGETRTFDLRYMYNFTSYAPGGPILFYTGNEGKLEGFVEATGIMFDIAPMLKAAIVFAEHRFYGQSQPFGDLSYSDLTDMGFLTSEQALADFAELISEFKRPNNQLGQSFDPSTPVISFGGSYGGMLSAWFRMKYPHIVKGAWAASAPLTYMRGGGHEPGVFDSITTRTYVDNGCNRYILANVWNATLRLATTADGLAFLNKNDVFTVNATSQITNATGAWNLNSFMREAIEYMAMTDYPYLVDFLETLPGYPVTVACQFMNKPGTTFDDKELVRMVGRAANIYYNYNNDTTYQWCIDYSVCGDEGTGGLGNDALGWPWQECSEIIMAMCAHGGDNDVFWEECGKDIYQTLEDGCVGIFGDKNWTSKNWDIDAVKKLYGFDLSGTSNLILTQGHLDPWSGGGYNATFTNPSRGIYIQEIPGAAHHLDLRLPNTCDPNTVTNSRFQMINIIKCWIDPTCTNTPQLTPLPTMQIPNVKCQDIVGGYPWGQTTGSSTIPSVFLLLAVLLTNLI